MISGQATTYDIPNYVGALFNTSDMVNSRALLIRLGVLTGNGVPVHSKKFEWQVYPLGARDVAGHVEGAAADTAAEYVRSNVYNTVQIFDRTVDIAWSALANGGQLGSGNVGELGSNPVADEEAWQIKNTLIDMGIDIDYCFINGTYNYPGNNSTNRRMGGLLEAIATNDVTGSSAELDGYKVNEAIQMIYDAGGDTGGLTILTSSTQKLWLTENYITATRVESTRNVGGQSIQSVQSEFGMLDILIDSNMPKDKLLILNLSMIKPRILYIPGMGFLFKKPVDAGTSSNKSRIYGEISLEWGNELAHAKLTGLTTAAPTKA